MTINPSRAKHVAAPPPRNSPEIEKCEAGEDAFHPLSDAARRAILERMQAADRAQSVSRLRVENKNNALDVLASSRPDPPGGMEVRRVWKEKLGCEEPTSFAFSPDGKTLTTVSKKGLVYLVAAEDGEIKTFKDIDGYAFHHPCFSPDGGRVALQTCGGKIMLLDDALRHTTWKREIKSVKYPEKSVWFDEAVAFSPDGTRLAVGSQEDQIFMLNAGSGDVEWSAPIDRHTTSQPAFSPDGTKLAVSSVKGGGAVPVSHILRLLDAGSGDEVWSKETDKGSLYHFAAFSPDGLRVAEAVNLGDTSSGYRGKIILYNAANGDVVWEKPVKHSIEAAPVFSPDGGAIAVASFNHAESRLTLEVYDAKTGRLEQTGETEPLGGKFNLSPPHFAAGEIRVACVEKWSDARLYAFVRDDPQEAERTRKKREFARSNRIIPLDVEGDPVLFGGVAV